VTEETLDEREDVVALDEGEDVGDEEPSDDEEDVVEGWTDEDPDRSVDVPDCAVARPMRPTTPMRSERIVMKEGKDVANPSNSKLYEGSYQLVQQRLDRDETCSSIYTRSHIS
jgi:hypothetical protein